MKQHSKKLAGDSKMSLARLQENRPDNNNSVSPDVAILLPSSYTTIFAECYDAMLWMNTNIKQLSGILDWLI